MKTFGRILAVLILFAAGGFVFYLGWIQFRIAPDSCGVLVSKTSGIQEKPVEPGNFAWRWEPVLPTNAELRIFSLSPYAVSKNVCGQLPSASFYSLQLKNTPDFSYSFDFDIVLRYTPEGIVSSVKKYNAKTQQELEEKLDKIASDFAFIAAQAVISGAQTDSDFSTLSARVMDFSSILADSASSNEIEILDFKLKSVSLPDMKLYAFAKKAFADYSSQVNQALAAQAAKDAAEIASDNRNIQRLEKMGELLKKYPELVEIIKTGTSLETLQSLQALQ